MELADFRKMNQVRGRVDADGGGPGDGRGAEALVPPVLQAADLQRRLPADLQPRRTSPWSTPDGKGVDRITETGLVVDGVEYEVDCIIFATGFEVGTAYTRRAGFEIYGRGGKTAQRTLGRGAAHPARLHEPGFPNCFHMGVNQIDA